MIELKNKCDCCGCEACVNVCPNKCINMQEDDEGFRYPVINKDTCINCNMCQKVCPLLNEQVNSDLNKEASFYAAYNKDDDVLKDSSSGGIFWLVVDYILKENGVIYGVELVDSFDVKFNRAETLEEAKKFRKSKYLQAKVNMIYSMVKADLLNGKKVLFSGTPCQVAALYSFLGKNYDNLYTIDIVCHGVPSNKVFRKYIDYVEEKTSKKVKTVVFRDKCKGWGPNHVTVVFEDGTSQSSISLENPFQTGFLRNYYLRPSCYDCKYAKLPRIGDISLADFWGYDGELLKDNCNKGLSAIIVSTKKGNTIFENIKENIVYHAVEEGYLTYRSRHVYTHPKGNPLRDKFFTDLANGKTFDYMIENYIRRKEGIFSKIKRNVRKILKIR